MALIDVIKDLFAPKAPSTPDDQRQHMRVATCVLLLEVANADDILSNEEIDRITNALRHHFSLSPDEAGELIEVSRIARTQSFDLWRFTNVINRNCSQEEKIRIVEETWRVVYSDGTLDAHEDHLAHKLADLLNLTHPQLITAKLKVLHGSHDSCTGTHLP